MDKWITIGVIVSIWGVSNSFIIKKLTNNKERFNNLKTLYIQKENEEPEIFEIEDIIDKKEKVIVKLKNNLKENIKSYIGRFIVIPEKFLESLKKDQYYIYQLFNLNVYNIDGSYLGKVIEFMENPKANDVLVIKNDKELLIPFIKEFIEKIDIENKKIIVKNI